MASVSLSTPWVLFYHEVQAFFKEDPEIRVIYDNEFYELKIYVDNPKNKAEAIRKLLPETLTFGNVELKIIVYPSNRSLRASAPMIEDIEAALEGNKALYKIEKVYGVFSNPIYYVIFNKEVVQYHTDDLSDRNGIRSTLYQDIAKEIFKEREGVFYCTAIDSDNIVYTTTTINPYIFANG